MDIDPLNGLKHPDTVFPSLQNVHDGIVWVHWVAGFPGALLPTLVVSLGLTPAALLISALPAAIGLVPLRLFFIAENQTLVQVDDTVRPPPISVHVIGNRRCIH